MKNLARLILLAAVCMLVSAPVALADTAAPTVEVAKKKKKKCKAGYKLSSGKCKKGPYKKGQTCSMSKQKDYIKYGLICLDLSTPGFPLTTLDVYKK